MLWSFFDFLILLNRWVRIWIILEFTVDEIPDDLDHLVKQFGEAVAEFVDLSASEVLARLNYEYLIAREQILELTQHITIIFAEAATLYTSAEVILQGLQNAIRVDSSAPDPELAFQYCWIRFIWCYDIEL